MVATTVLETAALVSLEEVHFVEQDDDWRRGIVQTRTLNGAGAASKTAKRYRLVWAPALAPQVWAIRLHHLANVQGGGLPFTYTPPGGAAISARYFAGPQVRHTTARSSSVEVVLEQVLNTD